MQPSIPVPPAGLTQVLFHRLRRTVSVPGQDEAVDLLVLLIDVAQLLLVDALRKSGLSIEGIQYFVRLQKRGDATCKERCDIVKAQEANMELQLADMEMCLERLRAAAVELSSAQGDS